MCTPRAGINVDGTIDGDLYVWGRSHRPRSCDWRRFLFVQTGRVEGQVDGSVRGACNNITISGEVSAV
jgi:hypothetical protein